MSSVSTRFSQIPTTAEVSGHLASETGKGAIRAGIASGKEHPVQLISVKNLSTGRLFVPKVNVPLVCRLTAVTDKIDGEAMSGFKSLGSVAIEKALKGTL